MVKVLNPSFHSTLGVQLSVAGGQFQVAQLLGTLFSVWGLLKLKGPKEAMKSSGSISTSVISGVGLVVAVARLREGGKARKRRKAQHTSRTQSVS